MGAAHDELDRGLRLADDLSSLTVPTPGQAKDTLNTLHAAVGAEWRLMQAQAPTDAVNPTNWARLRRQIERCYVEVSGVEGAAQSLASWDIAGVLLTAIKDAPRLLGEAGTWTADVVSSPVAAILTKLFENLWFWLGAIVVVLIVLPKLGLALPPVAVVP